MCLIRVEENQSYSNLLLNQVLQKHALERADAGLATELVYGTIGRKNTIDFFLERFVSKGLAKLEPWVRCSAAAELLSAALFGPHP